ncbi:hypothetical protein [Arthrobacter sp. Soil763]|uniref:hypothetical protein n=1 Tax=Arthrobacter sp. Soil763 TaxID=1736402 RepID=UPI001F1B0021|nr:hypothetical protein [Arthrobacter sp. Soil763]
MTRAADNGQGWPNPTEETMAQNHKTKQEARNNLFAAALRAPQPNGYPTHAEYTAAFDAYQAGTMQPLRDKLVAA